MYVNYAGIARFGFAIYAEAKYLVKDIKKIYQEYQKRCESTNAPDIDFEALRYLSLTAEQAAILHSLEYFKVKYDVQPEKDANVRKRKKNGWTHEQKSMVPHGRVV
ncbi:MAG: hypothetical protein LUE63_04470 [Lachnospiraceae bacterium]|nr:hypothetical protein [Lachnospiraceae bacterium]